MVIVTALGAEPNHILAMGNIVHLDQLDKIYIYIYQIFWWRQQFACITWKLWCEKLAHIMSFQCF